MALNATWHRAHPMPPKATLEQRVRWHIAHAKACGCRRMPESIRREVRRLQARRRAAASRAKATAAGRPR
ncbi:MAG: hypothetical protein R2752_15145 [Vicinamibacterales bacterium]